ncbi:C-C motif chemokine 14-like [Colossoma macropomum]|uniref:C-C motif chemokine 14-like n=1 Tax=Colossoma macropomum TaxID=42526 RepID=UPI001864FA51|nr:C-C motif chemokine 14-like [Colossoma macropomum]
MERESFREKMKMKISCVCLVLVLLMTVSSDATNGANGHPDNCCFSFVTFKIPDKEILEVERSHPDCPKKGFVFTTPRGRFCKKDLQ